MFQQKTTFSGEAIVSAKCSVKLSVDALPRTALRKLTALLGGTRHATPLQTNPGFGLLALFSALRALHFTPDSFLSPNTLGFG